MRILKIGGIILLIIIFFLLATAWYSGFFSGVEVVEKDLGPYYFVQHERFGDYKETKRFQDSLYFALQQYGVEATRGFGIYYDDPASGKPASQLHSIVGVILEEKDTAMIPELTRRGFRIEKMGITPSFVVEFPLKNELSIMAGISKAYPALHKSIMDNGFKQVPALEIYENNMVIFSMERNKD